MKISVPLTGTVVSYNPLIGDDNDPVRPIDISFGHNIQWELINIDLENDLALLDISVDEEAGFPTGEKDAEDEPVLEMRPITDEEKQTMLNNAKAMIQDKSIDQLYKQSKSARLKKPKVKKYPKNIV